MSAPPKYGQYGDFGSRSAQVNGDPMGRPTQPSPPGARDEGSGAALRSFIRVVRRRLPLLIVCMVVVPVVALAWSLQQDKEYSSSASLLFRTTNIDQSLTGTSFFSGGEDATRQAQTNVNLVSMGDVAARTAKAIDQPSVTPEMVKGSVSVSPEGESEVAAVEATTGDPELSALIANTFADQYIETRREADQRAILEAKDRVEAQYDGLSPTSQNAPQGERLQEQAEELEVLGPLQTGNAEVVQRATPNSEPVSPHPKRNAIVGLFLGLLLGLGLILLLEQLDNRIKDEEGIEDSYALPILAKIPHSGSVEPAARFDPIGLGPGGAEAFRMLHANLRYFNVGRKIDSLVVTSATPGEGKTTIAWGLAVTEARSGKAVLLIEADMRQPSLAERSGLGRKGPAGLSLVLSGSETLDSATTTVEVSSADSSRLDVMLSGPLPPNSAALLESSEMGALLAEARELYDLIVIDTPPIIVSDPIALMPQVSGVLAVSRLGYSRKDNALNMRDLLSRLDVTPFGVVLNDTKPVREGYYMPQAGAAVQT